MKLVALASFLGGFAWIVSMNMNGVPFTSPIRWLVAIGCMALWSLA